MKKILCLISLFVCIFAFNLYSQEFSKQATALKSSIEKVLKGKNISINLLKESKVDKFLPEEQFKNYRYVTIELSSGKRKQTISFLTDGKYTIRYIEDLNAPMVNILDIIDSFNNKVEIDYSKGTLIYGKKDSKIKVFIFGDMECPYCKAAMTYFKNQAKVNKDLSVYYCQYPLPFHKSAKDLGNMFYALTNKKVPAEKAFDFIENYNLQTFDLDTFIKDAKEHFNIKELDLKNASKQLENDIDYAKSFQITGTPYIIINGHVVKGMNIPLIEKLITLSKKQKKLE